MTFGSFEACEGAEAQAAPEGRFAIPTRVAFALIALNTPDLVPRIRVSKTSLGAACEGFMTWRAYGGDCG